MNIYLETVWEQEIYSKKSLKYLNSSSVTVRKLHVCWSSVRHNVRDNRRAELKVKVLIFVCFVALRPKSTAMVIAGRSIHITTLFPGQA